MKFIQPVSMKCTEEQFNKDLKSELEKIGYIDKTVEWCDFDGYLCSNSYNNLISNFSYGFIDRNNRFYIDHYNAELFLALAAMTDKEDGNYGEYWKCINNIGGQNHFTLHNLYKQIKENNGWGEDNKARFTKATKEEIINFFAKKETMTIVNIKKSDFKKLYDVACPEWKSKFDNFLIPFHFHDIIPFEKGFIEEMRKVCTPEQVPVFESIFGKKKVEIDYDKLKTGSKVMLKETDRIVRSNSKVSFDKPFDVVFFKGQNVITENKYFNRFTAYSDYATFHQNGEYCVFSSYRDEKEIDYITEVIEY